MKRKEKNYNGFCVLSLDPSLTAFGWCVVEYKTLKACGVISTKPNPAKLRIRKSDDRMSRIEFIGNKLKEVIEEYEVKFIVSELPHGSQSALAATALGLVSGLVSGASIFSDIGLEWYNEGECKKSLLGKISATKGDIIIAIDNLYNVPWKGVMYHDEAVADAMAVYHTAMKKSPYLKTFIKQRI